MRRLLSLAALAAFVAGAALAQFPGPPRLPQPPSPPKPPDLNSLRDEIAKNKYRFQVGPNGVFDKDLKDLTGLIVPPNIDQIARAQDPIARRVLEIDREARESAVRLEPSLRIKIYEFNIVANPTMKKWDWRSQGKVTPIKNQNPAGTCWAFSCIGALESSFLLRSDKTYDLSEQFMVSYSGAGTTSGGYLDKGNNWLLSSGTTLEATCPYNATNATPTPKTTSAPYDALGWGFVKEGGAMPSVSELKKALCEHGPLEAAVYADNAFKAYNGGIFDHTMASTAVNHAVMIVGWDDNKESWIIKNSWGTNWGETCGQGSQKGYMYIKYGAHNIGMLACWIKAKPVLYAINPDLLKSIPLNPNIKLDLNPLKL